MWPVWTVLNMRGKVAPCVEQTVYSMTAAATSEWKRAGREKPLVRRTMENVLVSRKPLGHLVSWSLGGTVTSVVTQHLSPVGNRFWRRNAMLPGSDGLKPASTELVEASSTMIQFSKRPGPFSKIHKKSSRPQ